MKQESPVPSLITERPLATPPSWRVEQGQDEHAAAVSSLALASRLPLRG